MQCELCGIDAAFLKRVIIEKVELQVCPKCVNLGVPATSEAKRNAGITGSVQEGLEKRAVRMQRKDIYDEMSGTKELLPGWGEKLKKARESKGFTWEDIASRVGQPVHAVAKYEKEELRPSDSVIAKLEKELDLELLETVGVIHSTGGGGPKGLTLGDLLKEAMRKK
ncbi:MAG: TIGR00270 family protein [Thermoplasmata archaeon HGW-Thermoplasmata-1]|nr:MAG: TIGR00270 family protein [Thermoplasmata archaeon HGW-Thermoplasmata-1]